MPLCGFQLPSFPLRTQWMPQWLQPSCSSMQRRGLVAVTFPDAERALSGGARCLVGCDLRCTRTGEPNLLIGFSSDANAVSVAELPAQPSGDREHDQRAGGKSDLRGPYLVRFVPVAVAPQEVRDKEHDDRDVQPK